MEHHTNISDALKEAGKLPAAMHVRNMQQQEEDRTLAIRIKYTERKLRKSGTNFSLNNKPTAANCKS